MVSDHFEFDSVETYFRILPIDLHLICSFRLMDFFGKADIGKSQMENGQKSALTPRPFPEIEKK